MNVAAQSASGALRMPLLAWLFYSTTLSLTDQKHQYAHLISRQQCAVYLCCKAQFFFVLFILTRQLEEGVRTLATAYF